MSKDFCTPSRRILLFAAGCALAPQRAWSGADPALKLAQDVADRPSGRDLTLLSRMELVTGSGSPRIRQLVTYRLDAGSGESAYLARFLKPQDIAGVGLLSLTRADGSTDQSLYLPELDRVRKISGDRKGGRFVGSDLYFEDLQERRPQRDKHRLVGQAVVGGVNCTMLESQPTDPGDSVYLKRVSWVDTSTKMAVRVDYFERDANEPSKRWLALNRQRIQSFWTVMASTMSDLVQGTETRMVTEAARYDRKLPSRLFTARALGDEGYEAEFRL